MQNILEIYSLQVQKTLLKQYPKKSASFIAFIACFFILHFTPLTFH